MALRVLIVDDEAPARSRLRRLLEPFVEAGRLAEPQEASDGVEAVAILSESAFDVALLDVRMPEVDGFGVLERVPPGHRPDVIFATAYDEYAIQAFEANATDYLLKPISAEGLERAISRVESRHAAGDDTDERIADLLDTLDQATSPETGPPVDRFTVQGHDRLFIVDALDVLAAEVQDSITSLFVRSGKTGKTQRHLVSYTLDALEGRLDPSRFMRVHRNAIVNLGAIREMVPWFSGRYKLVLEDGHEITASRARSRDLKERLSL